MSAPATSVTIPGRYCGPRASGNGGWTSGAVARLLGAGPGEAAEVRLHLPPPLDEALAVERDDDQVVLRDAAGAVVASGRRIDDLVLSGDGEPPVPSPATGDEAGTATLPWTVDDHPFPHCFVCGPARAEGDGLRIFAGRLPSDVDDHPVFAAPWTPDPSVAGPDGRVGPEVIWAALDCPGGQAVSVFGGEEQAVVLGTMQAVWDEAPVVGERYVLTSWPIAASGRKHTSGALLSDAEGRVLGRSRSVWIAVPRTPGG
ncbi:MAG: hypothetical protein U0Q07_07190 [Acidimicrobiales bacterium]